MENGTPIPKILTGTDYITNLLGSIVSYLLEFAVLPIYALNRLYTFTMECVTDLLNRIFGNEVNKWWRRSNPFSWSPGLVNKLLFLVMVLAISIAAGLTDDESGFFWMGPGAKPNDDPDKVRIPSIFGVKIDNWTTYWSVMGLITSLAVLEVLRFNTVSDFKQQRLKRPDIEKQTICAIAGHPLPQNAKNCDKHGACDRHFRIFKLIDGANGALFKVVWAIVMGSTGQFQYSLPIFAVEMFCGVGGVLDKINNKTDCTGEPAFDAKQALKEFSEMYHKQPFKDYDAARQYNETNRQQALAAKELR